MTSNPAEPMTEAERAAAAELTTPECPWHESCPGGCEAAQAHARAVIDASRRPIANAAQARLLREIVHQIETGALPLDQAPAYMRRRADSLDGSDR